RPIVPPLWRPSRARSAAESAAAPPLTPLRCVRGSDGKCYPTPSACLGGSVPVVRARAVPEQFAHAVKPFAAVAQVVILRVGRRAFRDGSLAVPGRAAGAPARRGGR